MNGGPPDLSLARALRASRTSRMAFTGAGGKTSAVLRTARDLLAAGSETVFVTTTTHFSAEQAASGDHRVRPADIGSFDRRTGLIVFVGPDDADGRVSGPGPVSVAALARLAAERQAPLLIEADGSRLRPVKAPAGHEPVIPDFVDQVVVLAGLSALGRPLDPARVHRPERFSELSGLPVDALITVEALADVLGHPEGGLKGIPPGARRVVLLNQADDDLLAAQGSRIANKLLGRFDAAVLAALGSSGQVLSVREPVAAIVLAAGASSRMGRSKQLLEYQGQPLVVHAARTALSAGCDPVIVVTGAEGEAVAGALSRLPVQRIQNDGWTDGQSTSVRAGLRALPANTGAAIFMLVDQPFIGPGLLRALIDTHAAGLAPIVAPLIDGQRGNPVLFDRATFPDFETLTGDVGARPLFSSHRVQWVPWHDHRALQDLDTPADYEDLVRSGDEEA